MILKVNIQLGRKSMCAYNTSKLSLSPLNFQAEVGLERGKSANSLWSRNSSLKFEVDLAIKPP